MKRHTARILDDAHCRVKLDCPLVVVPSNRCICFIRCLVCKPVVPVLLKSHTKVWVQIDDNRISDPAWELEPEAFGG